MKRAYLKLYLDKFELGSIICYKVDVEPYYKLHTDKECAKYFGIGLSTFKKVIAFWGISKTKEEIQALTEKTKLEKYGDSHFNNREKREATLIEQYGSLEAAYKDQARMCREVKLEKYGDPNYNNMEKNKKTCLERYGVDNVFKSEEIKSQIRATALERHNTNWPSQSEQTKAHNKETCLKRFGNTTYLGSKQNMQFREDNKDRLQLSRAQRFQEILKENPNYYKDLAAKVCNTKRKNNTFNTSKPENEWFDKLCHIFGSKNVIRQYKDNRYPFNCDFYIKSLDIFIEVNNFWTHGPHPFDITNEADIEILEKWQARQILRPNGKGNSYYVAEYVWTKLDVEKLSVARKNNLNYIMIYNNLIINKNLEEVSFDTYTNL